MEGEDNMCPQKHPERRTAREREREIEVRARVGENKGDGRIIPKGPCHIYIYIYRLYIEYI